MIRRGAQELVETAQKQEEEELAYSEVEATIGGSFYPRGGKVGRN